MLAAWVFAECVKRNNPAKAPLVLPNNELPDDYRWPVGGLDVMVVLLDQQSPERVLLLGRELIYAGALRVVVIGETDNLPVRLTLFKPKKMMGAA
ncbi:hypothetical protein BOW51_11660 [Solemya velesiana gill symbiont]|uniref:Uncharacterized protein n=1 Tax=Solemya velesiana gill symbiont TaxID=1918948 RepID=A0A1T2KQ40_9GAMM|nr:hypothetical protein BOW51_11660 [Solemya velesiana gill symbiont]